MKTQYYELSSRMNSDTCWVNIWEMTPGKIHINLMWFFKKTFLLKCHKFIKNIILRYIIKTSRDFPGSPVLGLHASTAEAMGSLPGQEPGGCNRCCMAEKKKSHKTFTDTSRFKTLSEEFLRHCNMNLL